MLLFNSRLRLFPGKFKSKWYRPFIIKEVRLSEAMKLVDPASSDPKRSWIVNGQWLKIYNGGYIERLTTIILLQDPWWVLRQPSDVREALTERQPKIYSIFILLLFIFVFLLFLFCFCWFLIFYFKKKKILFFVILRVVGWWFCSWKFDDFQEEASGAKHTISH